MRSSAVTRRVVPRDGEGRTFRLRAWTDVKHERTPSALTSEPVERIVRDGQCDG